MNDLSMCFKVVRHPRQDSEMRWSVFAKFKYEVAYRPGRNTGPMVDETKLYAFETQREAVRFAEGCRETTSDFVEVWLALAENAKPCELVSSLWIGGRLFDIFWGSLDPGDPVAGAWCGHPPPGTIECENIALIDCLNRFKGVKEPDLIFGSVGA